MFAWARRRGVVLVAVVFAGLGVGTVLAVQAGASGGGAVRNAPPQPAAGPTPQPPPEAGPLQPRAAGGGITPQALATNAHCGQTLTASLTLNGDLSCAGNGLIITGNSVNLNLGGHLIYGPGADSGYLGVDVRGTSDTVQNGVVANFYDGVYVRSSGKTDTILNVRATVNGSGIVDYGTGTKITTSVAARNTSYGIYSLASGGTYSGDHEVSNGLGLLVGGPKLVVTGNVANSNTEGIEDDGFGTTLTKNIADFNAYNGINVFNDTTVIDGGGNTAKGNDYQDGIRSEQCYGIVCT